MSLNLGKWLECVRRAFGSRYVRLLEDEIARERADIERLREEVTRQRVETDRERAEIARLRLENRAMLNSLLGTAGVPPVEEPRPQPVGIAPVRRRFWRPPI
jgi:hypothetical protein